MAKESQRKRITPTKKHIARIERERLQTRYIMIGTAFVIVLVIGVIVYGFLNENVLKYRRSIASVNGEKISAQDFRRFTKYYRSQLIQNAISTYQLASIFGSNPSMQSSIQDQLTSIGQQLDTFEAGESALEIMIDDLLVRQDASRLGITIDPNELEIEMQEALNYYAQGTPTSTATKQLDQTATLSPLQLTLLPRTPVISFTSTVTTTEPISIPTTPTNTLTPIAGETFTATITPQSTEVLTPTAILTPSPTPTPYTFEAYEHVYATMVADFETNYEVPEEEIMRVLESQLLREKVIESVIGEIPCVEEQVWALHILVEDEDLANDIYRSLEEGEDWTRLAITYSTDTSNKDSGGDLGWFSRGQMVPEFEEVTFSLDIGETSEPVQTQFGWHIIRVLGHEDRPISADACDQLVVSEFQQWLQEQRDNSDIEIFDFWQQIVPVLPLLPPEIQQIIPQEQQAPELEFPTPPS